MCLEALKHELALKHEHTQISQWQIQDFPLGGAELLGGGGGADLRRRHFLAKTYVKTKELDPFGGRTPGRPPGSENGSGIIT